jgi:hypothetical protein
MLIEVTAQTIADSAVIGDYDTIRRTLEKSTLRSQFAAATFIDIGGGRLHSESRTPPPRRRRPGCRRASRSISTRSTG